MSELGCLQKTVDEHTSEFMLAVGDRAPLAPLDFCGGSEGRSAAISVLRIMLVKRSLSLIATGGGNGGGERGFGQQAEKQIDRCSL